MKKRNIYFWLISERIENNRNDKRPTKQCTNNLKNGWKNFADKKRKRNDHHTINFNHTKDSNSNIIMNEYKKLTWKRKLCKLNIVERIQTMPVCLCVYVWWHNGRATNALVVMYSVHTGYFYHCCTSFNNQLIRWKTKHFLSIHWIFLSYQIMTTTTWVYLLLFPHFCCCWLKCRKVCQLLN